MHTTIRASAVGFVLLIAMQASTAVAQDAPRVDVAGGYAYLHESDLSVPAGWFAAVGGNINQWLGIVGAVSGHYKSATESGIDVHTSLHTFVAGPRFAAHANPAVTPYAQLLFGGARVSASVNVPGIASGSDSQNGFDFQPGAGVDITASRSVAVRLGLNADYIRSDGETNKEFQFIAGVVIRR